MIIDDFIKSFDELQDYALNAQYKDIKNPVDGVIYPSIADEIPLAVKSEIEQRLALLIGKPLSGNTMFLRQSLLGVDCPHQVHSDIIMGTYSLMLYINSHPKGGTSFVSHKGAGISYSPTLNKYKSIVINDQNNPDAWDIIELVPMKPNRALVFDSKRLHRAEPVGGFGETSQEARVVLTCFFS